MTASPEAIARCGRWLDGLKLPSDDIPTTAMATLARLLLADDQVLHAMRERERGSMALPAFATLAGASRARLLALVNRLGAVSKIRYPAELHHDYAELLGALAVSCAREGDLTLVAGLVRVAARLHMTGPMLDAAFEHLLEQQSEAGGFGLVAFAEARPDGEHDAVRAQLRTTVDVLLAWRMRSAARARS